MNILTFDTETTTIEHGHPFHKDNSMVCLGYKWLDQETEVLDFNDSTADLFNELFVKADLVVGMNLKFDLHWMRRIGCNLKNIKNVWDIQLAYFYLSAQAAISPSLNEISEAYGMGQKVDVIKLEYWDKGICTSEIPKDELHEYTKQDIILTEKNFIHQYELFTGKKL